MRKTEKRQFDQPLQVRVTQEQRDLFERAAQADGRSLSNWARLALERAARRELGKKGIA